MPAIETRSLRKVYPLPPAPKRRGAGQAAGASSARTAAGTVPTPTVATSATGPTGIVALDSLDLSIDDGEFFGLLGPNGAGKTTTIGILTTRVLPTAGEARVAGKEVSTQAVEV